MIYGIIGTSPTHEAEQALDVFFTIAFFLFGLIFAVF